MSTLDDSGLPSAGSGSSFPSLELDSELGVFVRRQTKHQAFARLFGTTSGMERLGRYRLLRLVGQGGMGVVYVAYDETLDREVAIKLVRTGAGGRARLLREGQAMARLTHPNVVRVYEVGEVETPRNPEQEAETIAFIVMEYVDGVTLDQWLRESRSRGEIVAMLVAAGRGLAAAHEAGLVHRDFKPQNVLVRRDGRVLVTDFGLAREGVLLVEERAHEGAGSDGRVGIATSSFGGTPAYMAPEELSRRESRAASDQYGFCVTLWEALYGSRPHQGAGVDELVHRVTNPPLPPDGRRLPRRLHELLLRGLSVDPGTRWPTMGALLDELEAIMTARRRWLLLGGVGALFLLGGAVLVLVLALQQRSAALAERDEELARANEELERELALSQRAQRDAEDSLSRQRGLRALSLIPEDQEVEALRLAVLAFGTYGPNWSRTPPSEARAALEGVLVDDARILEPIARLGEGSERIRQLGIAPDGRRIASIDEAGRVRVWEVGTGRMLAELGRHEAPGTAAEFSPDGTLLATSSKDRTVRIWDPVGGSALHLLEGHEDEVVDVEFSPRGDTLASASLDDTGKLWNPTTGELVATLAGHDDFVAGVTYSPDGELVATFSYDDTLRIWDAKTGAFRAQLIGHEDVVRAAVFLFDEARIVSTGHDGTTRVWSAESGTPLAVLERRPDLVYVLASSTDGTTLATGGRDRAIRVWNAQSRHMLHEISEHGGGTTFLDFLPGGRGLVSNDTGEPLRFWDLDDGRLVAKSSAPLPWQAAVRRFPSDARVATGRGGGTIEIWDPRVADPLVRIPGHRETIIRVALSPDGEQLATADEGGVVKLWDPDTGELQATLEGHDDRVQALRYSPSGAQLATGGDDHQIRLWESATGRLERTLSGHLNYVVALAYSPSGRQLASTSLDTSIRVWDLDTGRPQVELGGHGGIARGLAFSPDGSVLASADHLGNVQVWDAESWTQRCAFADGLDTVRNEVLFSPDGRRFVHTSADGGVVLRASHDCARIASFGGHQGHLWRIAFDGTSVAIADEHVRAWDVETRAPLLDVSVHGQKISALVLSPDGSTLAAASLDRRVELWSVDTGESVSTLREDDHVIRALAFSPAGDTVVLGRDDGRATMRDPRDGALVMTFADRVASIQADGSLLWPVPAPELLRLGCERLEAMRASDGVGDVCQSRPQHAR